MDLLHPDAHERAAAYLGNTDSVTGHLGGGTDGVVYSTSRSSAIKVFQSERIYRQERDAYLRLAEFNVNSVCGHAVPRLQGLSDPLRVIEMDIVRPPCLIDFGKTRLDHQLDFGEDAEAQLRLDVEHAFGEKASRVFAIRHYLWTRLRIDYPDLRRGNIVFAGERF